MRLADLEEMECLEKKRNAKIPITEAMAIPRPKPTAIPTISPTLFPGVWLSEGPYTCEEEGEEEEGKLQPLRSTVWMTPRNDSL